MNNVFKKGLQCCKPFFFFVLLKRGKHIAHSWNVIKNRGYMNDSVVHICGRCGLVKRIYFRENVFSHVVYELGTKIFFSVPECVDDKKKEEQLSIPNF